MHKTTDNGFYGLGIAPVLPHSLPSPEDKVGSIDATGASADIFVSIKTLVMG